MAQFNSVVLTRKGIALMAKALAGECQTEFTKVQAGDGTWSESEILSDATALKSVKQEFGLSRITTLNDQTVALLGVLHNTDLTLGYYIKEYGIFAAEKGNEDETEVLYAIMTAQENMADFMTPFNSIAPQIMEIETYVSVADAEQVTIKLGTGALASAEEVNNLATDVDELKKELSELKEGSSDFVDPEIKDDSTKPVQGKAIKEALDALQKSVDDLKENASATQFVYDPDEMCMEVSNTGSISGSSSYVLPAASATTLGGVKVGAGLSITEDGTLSADANAEDIANQVQSKVFSADNDLTAEDIQDINDGK